MLDDAAQTGSMPLVEAPMKERIAEIEEDEDIFAEALHKERVENAATVADYVGGDTASFRPLKLDEEAADEDVFEEQQDSNH